MTLHDCNIPESVVLKIPESVARDSTVIALNCSADELLVACPLNDFGPYEMDKLRFILNRPIRWEYHPRHEIESAIERHYGVAAGVENCIWKLRYQCPHRWQSFATTDSDLVRFCPVCTRNVYLCRSDAEVVRHAQLGHCIAKYDGNGVDLTGEVGFD